jgi:maltose O-acetyltransferase
MRSIILVLYYMVFSKLPSSYYPLGKYFNALRKYSLRNILPIGRGSKIQSNVYFGNGENIQIGSNCQLNENVKLNNVKIGDHVMIAPGVTVLGRMHKYSRTDIPMIVQGNRETKQTVIKDDVWIGTNAIIMPGIKISEGVIIGAGAVVTRDCQKYGVYVGAPAKLIKNRKSMVSS